MTALSNLLALLSLDNSDYLAALNSSQTASDSFATKLSNVGGAVVVGSLAVAATAITTVGMAAWDAGNTIDEAMDGIATKTGATGPELEGLQKDFEAVFQSVPTDSKTAADAIGILNSHLHISGDELQGVAKPLLEVTRITGGDLSANAENISKILDGWQVPASGAANVLDMMFVAAQKTGVGFSDLQQDVMDTGPKMRALGFNIYSSTAYLAKWKSSGLDATKMVAGMTKAAGVFAAKGIDMNKGIFDTVTQIQKLNSAGKGTEAFALATKVFGKSASDMFDAISQGKFDIGDLSSAMDQADGQIMKTAASTMDWGEKWTMFKNKVTVALAPIGASMMDGVGKAMDAVVAIFERPDVQATLTKFTTMIGDFINQAVAKIPDLINGFLNFITFLQNNQGIVIGILTALGVAALAWGVTTAAAAWTAMAPLLPVIGVLLLIAGAAYLLYQAWTNNWGGIQQKAAAVWAALQPTFETLQQWLSIALPAALVVIQTVWNNWMTALQAWWSFLQTYVLPILGAIANVIGAVLGKALQGVGAYLTNIWIPNFMKGFNWIRDNVLPVIQILATWLATKLAPAFTGIASGISKVVSWLGTLAQKISALSLPSWLTPGSPTPWEIGLLGIGDAMQTLSRSELPTFGAALQLHTAPLGSNGSFDLQARPAAVSTETNQTSASDESLLKDVKRLLRDLPKELSKVNRDTNLRAAAA